MTIVFKNKGVSSLSFPGRHVVEGTVGPTLEILLEDFKDSMHRQLDAEIGLKLLDI